MTPRLPPGLETLRAYDRRWLRGDVVAGVTVAAYAVPQVMAYAELAGLPAITGLYATVVCLVAYAVFGPSPYLVLGPDSSLGPVIAAIILPLAAGSAELAVGLAGVLALLVGAIAIGAGIARLGFVSDLLAQPVRRWRVVVEKFLAIATALVVMVLVLAATLVISGTGVRRRRMR